MADEIQILDISKNDTIRTAFDKINYNFDQLILHGGGAKGDQGKTGSHGPRGLTGSKIYALDEAVDLQLSGAENMDKIDPQIAIGDYVITTKGIYQFVDMPDSFTTIVKWDSLIEGSSIISKLRESQNSSPVVTQSASIASDGLWTTASDTFMRPVPAINGPVIGNRNSNQYNKFPSYMSKNEWKQKLEGSAAVILADSKISLFDCDNPAWGWKLLYGSSHPAENQKYQSAMVLVNDRLLESNIDFTNNRKSFWNLYKKIKNEYDKNPCIATRIAHDSICMFQTISKEDRWRFFAGYETGNHWGGDQTDFPKNEFAGYIIDTGENVNITGDELARLRSTKNTSLELYKGGEDNSSNTYVHLLNSGETYPGGKSFKPDDNGIIEMSAPKRINMDTPYVYSPYPTIYKQQDLRFTGYSGYNWLSDYEYYDVKNTYGHSLSLKVHNGYAELVMDIHRRGEYTGNSATSSGINHGIDGSCRPYDHTAYGVDYLSGSWQLPNSPGTSDRLSGHNIGVYFGNDNHSYCELTIETYDGPEYFKRTWNRFSGQDHTYAYFLERECGYTDVYKEEIENKIETKCCLIFADGGLQFHGFHFYYPRYNKRCKITIKGKIECIRNFDGTLDEFKKSFQNDGGTIIKDESSWLTCRDKHNRQYSYKYWISSVTNKVTLCLRSINKV